MSFRLESITLENFRRFVEPVTLSGFAPGLNLFVGPNGVGKSTVALGLRKLFFLYHRSKAASVVKEIVPWSAPGVSPRVTAQFHFEGQTYIYSKQWMKGAFARLESLGRTVDGDEAEQTVAQLLGFEASTRGETQLHGVPGLLWIEQGAAPDLSRRLEPASGYLREALGNAMGEIASTDGDEILVTLQAALGELRRRGSDTASKGILAEATARVESLRDEIESLEIKSLQYTQRVDELAALQLACATDSRDKPWLAFQDQAEKTRAALRELEALQGQIGREQATVQTLEARITLARAEGLRGEQLSAAIEQRKRDDVDARERLVSALSDHERMKKTVAQARVSLDAAELAVEQSRVSQRVAELNKRDLQLSEDCARQQAQIAQASECSKQVLGIRDSLSKCRVSEADLEQLRQWDQEIARLAGRVAAASTRLDFKLLASNGVALDGRQVSADEQAILAGQATLTIAGVGQVQISPGGTELEDSERARARMQQDRQSLLTQLGITSTSEAAAGLEDRRRLESSLHTETTRLADFAPGGLEQLSEQLRLSQSEQQQVRSELEQWRDKTGLSDVRRVAEVPTTSEAEQRRWQNAVENERRAGDLVSQARIRVEHTEQEVAAARQSLEQWQKTRSDSASNEANSREAIKQELAQLELGLSKSASKIAQLQESIAARDPEALKLDLQRFSDSASESVAQAQAREARRDLLAGQLSEAGAAGLEETLLKTRAEEQRWVRRELALQTRATALAWLVSQMTARRQALTDRLQAPLKERMNHYLKTLLPGANLELGADLQPESLLPVKPSGSRGLAPEQEPVNEQSFGTREQLSLLARLAYADLLVQANKPSFLVLDDGLLNADDQRFEQVKRMLYDAAQRHQIFIFSCHPGRWSGIGVAAREINDYGLIQ